MHARATCQSVIVMCVNQVLNAITRIDDRLISKTFFSDRSDWAPLHQNITSGTLIVQVGLLGRLLYVMSISCFTGLSPAACHMRTQSLQSGLFNLWPPTWISHVRLTYARACSEFFLKNPKLLGFSYCICILRQVVSHID